MGIFDRLRGKDRKPPERAKMIYPPRDEKGRFINDTEARKKAKEAVASDKAGKSSAGSSSEKNAGRSTKGKMEKNRKR